MDALVAAAKKEAALSTIALPNDWANYGEIKKSFFAKYNFLTLTDLNPDGNSAQEIEAIKANAGNTGPQNPDVIDVGFIWGDSAKSDKILQPYKVATWDTIPASIKDADSHRRHLADRGSAKPGRGLDHRPAPGYLSQCSAGGAERRFHYVCHCHGRIHHCQLAVAACLRPLHLSIEQQQDLRAVGGVNYQLCPDVGVHLIRAADWAPSPGAT